jgi:hypothetical protein
MNPATPPEMGDAVATPLGEWHNHGFTAREVTAWMGALTEAYHERRAPSLDLPLANWAAAMDLLFLLGNLEVLEFSARHFNAVYPDFLLTKNICDFFDKLPPPVADRPFVDEIANAVQQVPLAGAETALLLFCDQRHCLGMPLGAAHRWLARLPASLVYLRDFRRHYFLAGIHELGDDRAATLAALKGIAAGLGATRLRCLGSSMGVFGALHYGLALEAEMVVGLAGPTNLTSDFNRHLRWRDSVERIERELPGVEPKDMRATYLAAARRPRGRLYYADSDWDDRLQSEWMEGVPGFQFEAVEDFAGHNVTMELIRRGHFGEVLGAVMA